jgi:hypothetical protein
MGKYNQLKGALPAFALEQTYQAKVDEAKTVLKVVEMTAAELGAAFIETQDQIDEVETRLKALNVMKEAIAQEMIKALEEDGVTSFRLATGVLIYQQDEPYTSVVNREEYLNWIRKNGYEGLLNVPYQSTNALAKTELMSGNPKPAGTEVFMKTSIRYRRG